MSKPWYREGLNFKCTGCGQCCTGSPGHVWVSEQEIQEMATFLNITVQDFIRRHTRRVGDRLSLLEHPKSYDCVFLKGRLCTLYEARPKQCRTFPWWPENLASKQDWEEAAARCEGINHPEAPLIPFGQIQENLE